MTESFRVFRDVTKFSVQLLMAPLIQLDSQSQRPQQSILLAVVDVYVVRLNVDLVLSLSLRIAADDEKGLFVKLIVVAKIVVAVDADLEMLPKRTNGDENIADKKTVS